MNLHAFYNPGTALFFKCFEEFLLSQVKLKFSEFFFNYILIIFHFLLQSDFN